MMEVGGRAARGGRNQRTARAGEAFVVAELNKRGAYAVSFAGNMPRIDVMATDAGRTRTVFIQVKTMHPARSKEWQIGLMREKPERLPGDDAHFVVFVDLGHANEPPQYWIAPAWWVHQHVYDAFQTFLARHGKRPKNPASSHWTINKAGLAEWAGRWEVLGVLGSVLI